MGTVDISYTGFLVCFLLLLLPLFINYYLKLGLFSSLIISVFRMTGQLLLVGLFLKYIFNYNNALLNLVWVLVMIFFATHSTLKSSKLNMKKFLVSAFSSITIASMSILFFFNFAVVRLTNIFDAKYLIAIGGMLLGNSLRSNVIALSSFYKSIKMNENRHVYRLASGATLIESLAPHFKEAILAAFSPMIAIMTTMGIVSLPGMMTGQILGGSSPLVAVKYQIAVMIAIFSCMSVSSFLSVYLSLRVGFNSNGLLNKDILTK